MRYLNGYEYYLAIKTFLSESSSGQNLWIRHISAVSKDLFADAIDFLPSRILALTLSFLGFQMQVSLPKAFYIIKTHKSVGRLGQLLYRASSIHEILQWSITDQRTGDSQIAHWLIFLCIPWCKAREEEHFFFRLWAWLPARLGISPKCEKVVRRESLFFLKKHHHHTPN